jgi:hypothetical protein
MADMVLQRRSVVFCSGIWLAVPEAADAHSGRVPAREIDGVSLRRWRN